MKISGNAESFYRGENVKFFIEGNHKTQIFLGGHEVEAAWSLESCSFQLLKLWPTFE